MNYANAIPHTILGYVQYDDGIAPDNFYAIAYNKNLDEYFYNITIVEDGLYFFDVGSPGPDWKDGDEIIISVNENINEEYINWSGKISIILNFNSSFQQVEDIILFSPHENNNQGNNNDKKIVEDDDNFITFLLLIILVFSIAIIVIYLLYIKK
jgi:hypothetical protein